MFRNNPGCGCCANCAIYTDTFSRSDESPAVGWDVLSGSAAIVSNELKVTNGTIALAENVSTTLKQYAKVWWETDANGAYAQLLINATDDGQNYIMFEVRPSGGFGSSTLAIKTVTSGGAPVTRVAEFTSEGFTDGTLYLLELCITPAIGDLPAFVTAQITELGGGFFEGLTWSAGSSLFASGFSAGVGASAGTVYYQGDFYFGQSGLLGDDTCDQCTVHTAPCSPCVYSLPLAPLTVDFGSGSPTDNGSPIPQANPLNPSMYTPCSTEACGFAVGQHQMQRVFATTLQCRYCGCTELECTFTHPVAGDITMTAMYIRFGFIEIAGVDYIYLSLIATGDGCNATTGACFEDAPFEDWGVARWLLEIDTEENIDCANDLFPAVLSLDYSYCTGLPATVTVSL